MKKYPLFKILILFKWQEKVSVVFLQKLNVGEQNSLRKMSY